MDKILFFKIISRIFDPIILVIVIFTILIAEFDLAAFDTFVLFVVQILAPIASIVKGIRAKKYDIDMTNRKLRIPILRYAFLLATVGTFYSFIRGYTYFVYIQSTFLLIFLISLLITVYWKISYHAFFNTIAFILLYQYFNKSLLPIYCFIIILVGVSRIYLGKHTTSQYLAGVLLALTLLFLL